MLDGRIANPWQWEAALSAAETARARAREDEFWACGSRAELALLAPYAGREPESARVVKALRDLEKRALSDRVAFESTARQLAHYLTWWTSANGFFPGAGDLVADVEEAIAKAGVDDWSSK